MSNVIIYCNGGLGNRFGALISGLALAKSINKEPIICWSENNWCGCSFQDLFNTNYIVVQKTTKELVKEMLQQKTPLQQITDELINRALKQKLRENLTVILVVLNNMDIAFEPFPENFNIIPR